MTPTRPRDLLLAAVVTGLLVNVAVALAYGSLPDLPLLAGSTLGLLGVGLAVAGSALRRRIRGEGVPVNPLVAARAVVVAQATALGGAVVAGAWSGVLVYALPRAGVLTAAAGDAAAAAVGLVCALVLVGGGLFLEHCLRTPEDRDARDPGDRGREAG